MIKKLLPLAFLLLFLISSYSQASSSAAPPDSSMKLLTEFSLFNEYHKNNDYPSAVDHGWYVVNTDPTQFVKFRVFRKMEDILWDFYDKAETEEEKMEIADTTLYLYDKGIEYNKKKAPYFQAKKGYVLEVWKDAEPELIIEAYEKALEMDPELSTGYQDRLGLVYIKNESPENDYKVKALELYSKLSEEEPDNALWLKRIESLAGGDLSKLVDIKKQTWELDKDNLEKAWSYASACLKNQDFEKSIEPLKFLTDKAPDVINYWDKLASSYQKLGQDDNAIAAYKSLIKLQPNNRDSYLNIALVYKKLGQLSVARSYLYKAMKVDPNWAYPHYVEGQLYEQTARDCTGSKMEFMDKCVFKLAADKYRVASQKEGRYASIAGERAAAFKSTVPQKEDYFFRKYKSGDKIKIEGKCYSWIGKSIIVP